MKRISTLILIFSLLLLLALAACSSGDTTTTELSDADALATAQAASVLPTQMVGQGMRSAKSTACLVWEDVSISTDTNQGDLLAWSPDGKSLAYVRPANGRWAWFVGDMVVYDFDSEKETYTSSDLEVFGDLTWSPDGSALAYVVLDPTAEIYTANVINLTTGTDISIFSGEAAKTDEWSSTKGISSWTDANSVVVTSSCGLDCSRIYSYNINSGVMTISGETRKKEDLSLTLINGMTSPDGVWQIEVDNLDNLWLANSETGRAFILLAATPVSEIKWSQDSQYLAIRIEEKVQVYQPDC
jgi:dipeptidyl aminopeptidase/acylaminoacyl peptidase